MGKVTGPPIRKEEVSWLKKQHLFFVATAPLSAQNHVNLSPKSAKEFRILDDKRVCYLDYCGSGAETSCHINENGRCTFMFVALTGAPKIVRLYGKGKVHPRNALFNENGEMSNSKEVREVCKAFDIENNENILFKRCRSVIVLNVDRISSSCGYSIPKFDYVKDRNTLNEALDKVVIPDYIAKKNSFSIDGIKGIGQTVMSAVPVKRVPEKGYYFAEYKSGPIILNKDDQPLTQPKNHSTWMIRLRQLYVQLQMAYARGLNGVKRDLVFFISGVAFLHILRNISSILRRNLNL